MLVGSGVKNFLGNTKHFIGNLMIGAGEKGICCYQSDGGNGHANHIFANNTCIYSGDGCRLSHAAHDSTSGAATRIQPYRHTVHCVPNSTQPGSPAFRAWMRNSSFASSGPPLTPHPSSLLSLWMCVASFDRLVVHAQATGTTPLVATASSICERPPQAACLSTSRYRSCRP